MSNDELNWIEQQGQLNMDFHLKNMEALTTEAHVTLSALMVLIPAAVTCAAQWWGKAGYGDLSWAMVLLAIYLWFIVLKLASAIKSRDILASGNEPMKLRNFFYQRKAQVQTGLLENVREGELKNLQDRIDFNRKRSIETGDTINECRTRIFWAPVWFAGFWLCVFIVRAFHEMV